MSHPSSRSQAYRRRYPIFVQIGLVLALLLMIGLFSSKWRAPAAPEILLDEPAPEPVHIEIERTRHVEPAPPPPQPPPPIAGADELGDLVLERPTEDLWEEIPHQPMPAAPPPLPQPEPQEGQEPFLIVERMPELVGGYEELHRRLRYPELARRVGIEGTVFLEFVVDEDGRVSQIRCVREPGGGTCEAAFDALRQSRFRAGLQRNQPVTVRMTMPVHFRLR